MNMGPIAANGAAQPVVIEYHIHYQTPRQPAQPALQPAPQFQGFPGPAGVWQPWPPAAQGQGQDAAAPIPVPTIPVPTVVEGNQGPQPTPAATGPQPTPTATDAPLPLSEAGSTPREAAALAALRRHNSARPADSPTPTPTPTTSSPSPSQPADAATSTSSPSATAPNRRPELPTLIPMYDYTASGSNPNTLTRPSLAGARTTSQSAPSPPTYPGSFRPRPSTRPPPDPRYQQRPPLSQLPPTLTDEQLALMDSVTRDAIDERLRVLEGVSGAVYRCIDDLMRMRSALPVSTPPNPIPAHSTSSESGPATASTSNRQTSEDAAAVPIPDSPTTPTAAADTPAET
ncbi:hypothetical protein B0H17DRAFT_1207965 [Mycena rosella]|uniref:Uncharacterized protein n=1 Tax=Mycena rosella TaxID=1033263 RepID=A0AAD7D1T9_MYCRO|nr:hypothetical protein B0H17DRAFT_1207965 [Mycena rosella]